MVASFLDRLRARRPMAYDVDAAERLLEAVGEGFPDKALCEQVSLRDSVTAIGGCSPYLTRLMLAQRGDLPLIFGGSLEESIERACAMAATPPPNRSALSADEIIQQTMSRLRRAKSIVALTGALGEISGAWSVFEAAAHLSRFADAALSGAMQASLAVAEKDGFHPIDRAQREHDCGVAVLAMGKLGGGEVNYSSDIDIIVLYDPEAPALGDNARVIALNVTKSLVNFMAAQTRDGYVFRTDLRLRPDPGSSAAAVSVDAAEAYYEAYGQNWERAAFIRARAAAGDKRLGEAFLETLRPFVWRKYLDFAALEDIHSIKRQVHAAKGGANIDFAGHDLKTGAGGIREVEFFAQTQQLILGGKNPNLRVSSTRQALTELQAHQAIDETQHDDLLNAYTYLRHVEHRLQMINDEQTHAIPTASEGIERLAAFLGFADSAAFEEETRAVFDKVHRHFADLFEQEAQLSSSVGSLSFTGVDHDPRTIKSLRTLGFSRPETISDAVRRWHSGSLRATRTPRARELLTRITPQLLESLSKAASPDEAFVALDAFLTQLPSGVQIFSLFANSAGIFDRLTRIVTVAPELARKLARRRHLVEALVEASWLGDAPIPQAGATTFRESLLRLIADADDFEATLNAARRITADEKFITATKLVLGDVSPSAAATAFTAIADAVIETLAPEARAEMERLHGIIDGELVVIGLGRLGAGNMTAASDVDLIFVYDAPAESVSSGDKSLSAGVYFTRLVRRIVTALTAPTEEGALYDVDMQLRPSGGAGPAAVSKAAFQAYFAKDAWTWEVMALTKARMIATLGCGQLEGAVPSQRGLREALEAEINAIISRPRERKMLAMDVHAMRSRLLAAKPPHGPWDIKRAIGGLTELDFILQYLQLLQGRRFGPSYDDAAIADYLGKAGQDCIREAADLFQTVMQIGRAATGTVFTPAGAGLALGEVLSQACQCGDIIEVENKIAETEARIAALYDRLIADQATD